MPTAFRSTAILPDRSGRYRTGLCLATRLYGEWSEENKAEHCERQQLPTRAIDLTDEEYVAIQKNADLAHGYVDTPGDTETPFTPEPWRMGV